jgi:hypothetical protein
MVSFFSNFSKRKSPKNDFETIGVSDISTLLKFMDIIYGNDKKTEMKTFIDENQSVFFKRIPMIQNGTILHALSYGEDHFKNLNINFGFYKINLNFDKIIQETINYFENHNTEFMQLIYLKKNGVVLLDIRDTATPPKTANEIKLEEKSIMFKLFRKVGGKRKTKRFNNKKKKTQKRRK